MVEINYEVDWGRAGWLGLGAVLVGGIALIVHAFIGTFVFGLFIYYATRRLHRRLRGHVGQQSVAAALSILGLALPAIALVLYAVAIGLQELNQFASRADFGPYLDYVRPYLQVSQLVDRPEAILSNPSGVEGVRTAVESFLGSLGVVGTGLIHLFVMFALAFYLLRDGHRLATWAQQFESEYEVLISYVGAVDESLDKVFYGNILNAAVTGTLGAFAYSILNLTAPASVRIPYPALTGLLTGVASLIPLVGMKLVYVPIAAYLAFLSFTTGTGWAFLLLFVVVSLVIVDAIPDFLVRPYVSGGDLHVGSLMFAYILGPLLFGWYGIFLGPILLVLFTHFVRLVLPELLARQPIEPAALDLSVATDDEIASPNDVVGPDTEEATKAGPTEE
jgi:predicted PurR-regulated permease PerM